MDMGKLYESATSAIERGNYDYAITLLIQLLKIQPEHQEARQKLRETEVRKFQQLGKGASGKAMAWLTGLPAVFKIIIGKIGKKHESVMAESENFLANDPTNKFALTCLAQAAEASDLRKVAIDTYSWIHENYRSDIAAILKLGELHTADKDISKAMQYYELYSKLKPEDRTAEQQLRDLAAMQTMDKGYSDNAKAGDFKKLIKDKDEAKELQEKEQIIRTDDDVQRAMDRAHRDLERNPKDRKALLSLGQLYRRAKQHDKSVEAYQRVLEIDPTNVEVQDALGDLKYEQMKEEIKQLQVEADKPDAAADAAEKVEAKRKEAVEFMGSELDRRVKARPTDLQARHFYGRYLFSHQSWDGAIAQLQHSQRDPRYRREALNKLGQCFYQKGMFDMAESRYKAAFDGVEFIDEQAKDILYNWAVAAESGKHMDVYESCIRRIFENDINYKDVSDRMEAVYKIKRGEG